MTEPFLPSGQLAHLQLLQKRPPQSPNCGDRYDTLPVIEGICTDECESGTFKVLVRLGTAAVGSAPRRTDDFM